MIRIATNVLPAPEALRPSTVSAVLVPLDGSEQALAAVPVARALAELEGAILHLVHIAARTLPPRQLLEELGLDVEQFHGSIVDQAVGDPAGAIVELARRQQSPYIVMCTHAARQETADELGSVTRSVLSEAPCPVVLVPPIRGRRPLLLRHLLLPHSGCPTDVLSTGLAREFAERAGAELTVLHVTAPGLGPPAEPGSITTPRYVDQAQYEWPVWAREFLDRMCCELAETPQIRLALAVGEIGPEVVRTAREHDVDLIVLGWHGHWEGEHAATIKTVVRNAPCPTLVLRVATET